MDVRVVVFVVAAGVVGAAGLVLAAWQGLGTVGRWCLLSGLGASGVVVGLVGTMIQGYTVRVGGSGPRLMDAGDPASGTGGGAGFAFPAGAVVGLVFFTALLLVAASVLRQPLGVLVAAGGWLAIVGTLMFGVGDRGNVILANNSSAQIYVYGGLVVAFGIAVLVYQWQLTDRLAARAAASRPVDRVR
ncbi:hypothetical protein GCM10009839_91580 [Catenulispora yoronensis]|uniref:Uncharacterized protein n=1 Tax=Catenulispora yoronensis TaxID=450799 RepID=A0ABN2VRB3_9ACTN